MKSGSCQNRFYTGKDNKRGYKCSIPITIHFDRLQPFLTSIILPLFLHYKHLVEPDK